MAFFIFFEGNSMRILVINSEDLLSGGVVSLLRREEDFEIVTKDIPDKSALASEIEGLKPDAVLINESFLFTYPASVLHLLQEFPELRVIVLDENQNLLHIYKTREVVVERSLDLIATIRGN